MVWKVALLGFIRGAALLLFGIPIIALLVFGIATGPLGFEESYWAILGWTALAIYLLLTLCHIAWATKVHHEAVSYAKTHPGVSPEDVQEAIVCFGLRRQPNYKRWYPIEFERWLEKQRNPMWSRLREGVDVKSPGMYD